MLTDRVTAGGHVEVVAILDEVVLRRGLGGPDVMREQLEHIAAQAGEDHIKLVIIPTTLGGHPGLAGAFELVEYRDDPRSATVFIESQTDDQIVHGPGVDTYQQIVAELTSLGLGGTDAVALVNEIRSEI